MHFLGIDVGTTGARAVVVRAPDGTLLASATAAYPLDTPRPQWAQQNPDDWWRGTQEAVAAAVGEAGVPIDGIGLSGQMHGVTLLDAAGRPLGPAIIWCDSRCDAECREITEIVGADRLIELAANPALVGFSAPKLRWLQKNEPEQWRQAKHFLLPKDYVRYKLTGAFATEVSDASGTLLFDVANRRWSTTLCAELGIDPMWLPEVHESTMVSGAVSTSDLGLTRGTPVVGGGGDQAAGAVGAGIVGPGRVSVTVGSSGVVFAHSEQPLRDPRGRVHTFCHAVPGAWHVMGVTQGAGLSLRWLRDTFFPAADYDTLTAMALEVPSGSEGLLFLPYLMGERTPHLDANARGVFCGLTAAHKDRHMVRAVLEGVAFSLRDSLDVLLHMGVPTDEIRMAGGGARSDLWCQIHADVLGRDVLTLSAAEGPAYGAALLAGVGLGAWPSVQQACEQTVSIAARTTPDEIDVERYRKQHGLYADLYRRLRDFFPALS